MEQPSDDITQRAAEEAADRLGVPLGEIWRLIGTGELSFEETADGLWVIPDWSLDYLLLHRARANGTAPKPARVTVLPPVPLPEKKKTKKKDPAKKWKQRFDAMGKEKNDLSKQLRASRQAREDPQIEKRTRELERRLDVATREIVRHVKVGVEAGFIDPPKLPKRRGNTPTAKAGRAAAPVQRMDLEKLGLQVGLSFSKETEIMNAFDPRRKLEVWEKPRAARGGSYQRPDE